MKYWALLFNHVILPLLTNVELTGLLKEIDDLCILINHFTPQPGF